MYKELTLWLAPNDKILYDLDECRQDFQSIQHLIDIVQRWEITKLYVYAPPEMFVPIFELVDVIFVGKEYVDAIMETGFGHKVRMSRADVKYFGLIHPKSCFNFTSNPRVRRLFVWTVGQLRALVGRELDFLHCHIFGEYSLEGINTAMFVSKYGSPDIRPLLMCSRLEKLIIGKFSHPVEQVECYELKYYRCHASNIPAIDEMIDNRRLKKIKVAVQ